MTILQIVAIAIILIWVFLGVKGIYNNTTDDTISRTNWEFLIFLYSAPFLVLLEKIF